MTMDKQLIWVRDPNEGFILARLHELMGEEADVYPVDNKYPKRVCSFEDIFPAGDPTKSVDDNCKCYLYFFSLPLSLVWWTSNQCLLVWVLVDKIQS